MAAVNHLRRGLGGPRVTPREVEPRTPGEGGEISLDRGGRKIRTLPRSVPFSPRKARIRGVGFHLAIDLAGDPY